MTVALFAGDKVANGNTLLVTLVGALWFLVMAAAVIFGVHHRARPVDHVGRRGRDPGGVRGHRDPRAITTYHHGQTFSWDWFGFGHLTGAGVFVAAALIAAFYYWGWDVTANLGEETKDAHKTTGAAGILGIVIVFILFEIYTTTTLVMLPGKTIEDNAANVLGLGDAIMPGIGGKIMIVAVALSTIATLETTLVQVSRTLFAMGATARSRSRSDGSTASGRRRCSRRSSSSVSRCCSSCSRTSSATASARSWAGRSRRSACRSRSTTRWRVSPW
jgi:amino acid transporter